MADRECIQAYLQPLSLLDCAVLAIDQDFHILYQNPAANRMYALDTATANLPIYELIRVEDPEMDPRELIASVLDSGAWKGIANHEGSTFDSIWVEWSLKRLDLPELERPCIVSIAWDIRERKQTQEALRVREETLQSIFRATPTGIGVVVHRVIQRVNQQICEMLGRSAEELVGQNARILYPSDQDYEYVGDEKYRQISTRGVGSVETRWQRADSKIIDVRLTSTPIDRDDLAGGVTFTALDITARKRAARKQAVTIEVLELLNRVGDENSIIRDILLVLQNYVGCKAVALRLRDLDDYPYFEASGLPVDFLRSETSIKLRDDAGTPQTNEDGAPLLQCFCGAVISGRIDPTLPHYTPGGSFWTGCTTELMATNPPEQLPPGTRHRCCAEGYESLALVPLRSDAEVIGLLQLADTDKNRFTAETVAFFEQIGASIGIALARAQAGAQRLALEHQLQQSQKMEAIGRLAGGVAHDFNNLLTAIFGYSQIVHDALDEADPLRRDVAEIEEAAQRAGELTKQLLSFSRRQDHSPEVIDPNRVIARAEKMLRRIIGEDVALKFIRDDNAGFLEIDPGQLDQILVNLSVNARDAMPRGGQLLIETTRWSASATSILEPLDPKLRSGEFVRLQVSDSGEGIPADVLPHIFEPFFTTKGAGEGTGLGLATIYGIVSQNQGVIETRSNPGRGATFSLYFPRIEQAPKALNQIPSLEIPQGRETILLAEDDNALRGLAKKMLTRCGYRVLSAADGDEAYRINQETADAIDLLVTDVVMPNRNGKELYKSLLRERPDIRVLYMSGHADTTIAHHGVLEHNAPFLAKPFTHESLAIKVREVLDR